MIRKIVILFFCTTLLFSCGKKSSPEYKESKKTVQITMIGLMNYKKNSLYIENISIQRIAKKFGTPSYCYSLNRLKLNIRNFKKYFRSINPLLCFSVKSNSNLQILKEINDAGMGADVVSKGELMMALKAGISSKKIVFSGFG